jgi:hypothetical protein
MNKKLIVCKNCQAEYEGRYCPNCRQPANTSRITGYELSHNFLHAVFHLDRGIVHTVIEMLLRPGITIRDYLNGKRAYHFNPFLFLILLAGAATLLFSCFHVNVIAENIDTESIEKFNPIFAHKHFTIVAGIILVFLTLTDFVLYGQKKYTLAELLVSNSYQIGELLFFLIVSLPFLCLQNYIGNEYGIHFELRYVILVLFYGYFFWVRYELYQVKSNYLDMLKIGLQLFFLCAVVQYRIARIIVENIQ